MNDDNKIRYQTKKIKLSQSFLHFSILHRVSNFKIQVLLTIVLALFFSFFGVILIQNTGLYGMGIEGISQGFARLGTFLISYLNKGENAKQKAYIAYNILFWVITLLLNIPLLILAYFKVGKRFFKLTTIFMIASTIFGIAIGFIPNIEKLFIFGNLIRNTPQKIVDYKVQIVFWNREKDAIKQLSLFLYGIAWAIIQAFIASALFILSSSSGGFDILGMWYSRKYFKSVGSIFMIIHLISLLIANTAGTFIPIGLTLNNNPKIANDVVAWSISTFFNPNLISGIVMILLNGFVVNLLFPKYNLVHVQIYSSKAFEINELLKNNENNTYATSITKIIGGYTLKEKNVINTTCMYFDAASLLLFVRKIDTNAFFTITDIKKADGYIYVSQKIEENDINKKAK